MNIEGTVTLFNKEVRRFMSVAVQTVLAPVVTTLLYLLVFAHALGSHVEVFDGIAYLAFLVPGLIMMTVIQNAFANSSSSLIQSKMNGSLVFLLLAPVSGAEIFIAFVAAAVVRGLMVGFCVWVVALFFVDLGVTNLGWLVGFVVLASGVLGAMGLVAGLWAEKFDQLSAFQNFIILPLSFLSGVFYSLDALPEFWQTVSRFNPFFYMIDGFRYGFIGVSDADPMLSMGITVLFFIVVSSLCLMLLTSGYRVRQ